MLMYVLAVLAVKVCQPRSSYQHWSVSDATGMNHGRCASLTTTDTSP